MKTTSVPSRGSIQVSFMRSRLLKVPPPLKVVPLNAKHSSPVVLVLGAAVEVVWKDEPS